MAKLIEVTLIWMYKGSYSGELWTWLPPFGSGASRVEMGDCADIIEGNGG